MSTSNIGLAEPLATADLALATLQYLPTPLIVLSGSKMILLANDAMRCLLASDDASERQNTQDYDNFDTSARGNVLHGLSLSQIGLEPVLEDHQGWTAWEVSLHRLCLFIAHVRLTIVRIF